MIVKLPFFDELNSDLLKDYYEVDVNIDKEQNKIQLDINFNGTTILPERLVILKNYLEAPEIIVEIAKKEILNNFENGEEVNEFLTHHIEVLDQSELDDLLKNANKTLSLEEQILSTLNLRRIGFYPDNGDFFAILDFVLNEEISDQILVVMMTDHKTVDNITMES